MSRVVLGFGVVVILSSALVVACSSKSDPVVPAAPTGPQSTAAAVAGAADSHCAGKPIVVASQAACHPADAGHEEHGHDHGEHDAGEADAGEAQASTYGPTQFGSEGDDDQCKYRVKWTSTPVTVGADVTLAVAATNRNDSSPVAGAKPYAEIFLDDTHPGPNTPVQTTEISPGNYTIGPVRFDAPGNWNVRFHFSADCVDGDESPHGHVAFFVKVP